MIYVRRVVITEQTEEKLWNKHRVMAFEVHEVFDARPHIQWREKGKVIANEDVYTAWGRSEAGRYLIIFFIYKQSIQDALVLSARDMTKSERKFYAQVKR
jgi:uncharacterized DUF497 family protein